MSYFWLDEFGNYNAYSEDANATIEQARKNGLSSVDLKLFYGGKIPTHQIAFTSDNKITQMNLATGTKREVKRVTAKWKYSSQDGEDMFPFSKALSHVIETKYQYVKANKLKAATKEMVQTLVARVDDDRWVAISLKKNEMMFFDTDETVIIDRVAPKDCIGDDDDDMDEGEDQNEEEDHSSNEYIEKITAWEEVDDFSKLENERCSICLCDFSQDEVDDREVVHLSKCAEHYFHKPCILQALKSKKCCPTCMIRYGVDKGIQPKNGIMQWKIHKNQSVSGHGRCGVIEIVYNFPSGKQTEEHPNPGKPYEGTVRYAYLPNNKKGKQVLDLLRKAFENRLVFTVGRSITTGRDNCVVWNGIHHKTSLTGGSSNFGYPDKTYLDRVQEELAAKGIVS